MAEWVVGSIVTLVVASLTVGVSYLAVRVSRRESETSATDVVTDAAVALIAPLKDELESLRADVASLQHDLKVSEQERNRMHRWALAMQSQLLGASITPVELAAIDQMGGV